MGNSILIICFVVVVIGGIGSIKGAFLAAMLVGFVDTFGQVFFPSVAGVLVYVLMAGILLFKPEGLFKQGCFMQATFRFFFRSEELRVGNECVSTCSSWGSPYH